MEILKHNTTVVSSHTGSGKTAVFTTAARVSGLPTIIIEPRKLLQKQVSEEAGIFTIYGRNEYNCEFAGNASVAPCKKRWKEKKDTYFKFNKKTRVYPCISCGYMDEVKYAGNKLDYGDIIICNFGNYQLFKDDAQFIIIDEVDAFIASMSSPIKIQRCESTIKNTLIKEQDLIKHERKHIKESKSELDEFDSRKLNILKNKLEKINFFLEYIDELFMYTNNDNTFIEIKPTSYNIVLKQLFEGFKVCYVSATANIPCDTTVTWTIPIDAKVIYQPIGNMSYRNIIINNNQHLIRDCAIQITHLFTVHQANKTVVHCGNLSNHGQLLFNELKTQGLKPIIQEETKLKETIESFYNNSYNVLLAVSADYGFDFKDIPLQFILKIPYATLDNKMKALKKQIGGTEFNKWYSKDALNRLIQQAGRIGRGLNGHGNTYILDEGFLNLHNRFYGELPEWFKKRLVFS